MRTSVAIFLALFLVVGIATAAEVQVSMDRSGRVQRIDPRLASRLHLFAGTQGFQEARLFELSDSTFVLEITSLLGTGLERERIPLTAAGADSLRDQVPLALAERPSELTLEQPGRPLLVATTTVLGLGFYGWALPVLANVEGDEAAGVYLLAAGASSILPMLLTHNQPVSYGAAVLSTYGATRGIAHGTLAPYLVNESPDGNTQLGSAVAFSLIEGVGGYLWAQGSGMSAGTAGTLANGGDTGLLFGLGVADMADASNTGTAAAALIGSAVGIAGGSMIASRNDFSYGDASVMRTTEAVAAYAGYTAVELGSSGDNHTALVAGSMVGAVLGLALGNQLVRETEFTFGQSVLIDGGTIGGGLLGLGVAFLFDHNNSGDSETRVLTTASALGAIAGFALTYSGNAVSARRANTDRSSWRFDITPKMPTHRGGAPGVTFAVRTTMR